MGYSRADVSLHSDGFRDRRPAVNVKVYGTMADAFPAFVAEERPDPRFTLAWLERNVSDEAAGNWLQAACEDEYEYFERWATGADGDGLFPDHAVRLEVEGRSGGWIAVDGLPDLEEWDAVLLARWRRFERIAQEIAAGCPFQALSLIYINVFDRWADDQEDRGSSNSEAPVDLSLTLAASAATPTTSPARRSPRRAAARTRARRG